MPLWPPLDNTGPASHLAYNRARLIEVGQQRECGRGNAANAEFLPRGVVQDDWSEKEEADSPEQCVIATEHDKDHAANRIAASSLGGRREWRHRHWHWRAARDVVSRRFTWNVPNEDFARRLRLRRGRGRGRS